MADDNAAAASGQQQSGQAQTGQAAQATIVSGDTAAAAAALNGTGQQQQTQTTSQAPTFPENWRDLMAGGDADARKRLDRFTEPALVTKSWLEAEKKISSGVFKKTLSENPTTDELAAYRKDMGLDADPTKYPLEAPKEITLSDADKPLLDGLKKFAHEHAIDPKVTQRLTNWYLAQRELELQDFNENIIKTVDGRRTELRTAMGADFDKNVAMGNAFIAEILGERGPQLASLKLIDGTDLGSHPDFVRFVAQAARTYTNGDIDLGGGSMPQGGESRINDLKKMMGDRQSDYWKGPKANELQAEYRNLIERQNRQKNRAA